MEVDSKQPAPPLRDGDKVFESRAASPSQQQTESKSKSMSDNDTDTDTDAAPDAASPQASQSDREPHAPEAEMGSGPPNVSATREEQGNDTIKAAISAPAAAAAAAAASDEVSAPTTRPSNPVKASGTGSSDVGATAARSTSHPASTSRAPSAQGFRQGSAGTAANTSSASPVLPSQGHFNALQSSNQTPSSLFQSRASAGSPITNTNPRDLARSQPPQQRQQQPQQPNNGYLFGVLKATSVEQGPAATNGSVNSPQFRSPQLQHAQGSSAPAAPQSSNSNSNSTSAQAPSTQWRMPYEQAGQTHQPPNQQSHQPHHQHQRQQQAQQQHRSSDAGQTGPGSASATTSSAEDAQFQAEAKMIGLTMQSFSASSIRRAIRDNWQKCLTGSDYHNTFLMNATIHNASPGTLQRALQDFGSKLIPEIANGLSTAMIDDITDQLLNKASDQFLDRALEKRLPTIPARKLLNALARAERLGYDAGDIVDDASHADPSGNSDAGVKTQPPSAPATQPQPAKQAPRPSPSQLGHLRLALQLQPGTTRWPPCDKCGLYFPAESARSHHVKRRVCEKKPPTPKGFPVFCQRCAQGFASAVGLQYHVANKVCGDFGDKFDPRNSARVTQPVPDAAHAARSTPSAHRTAASQFLGSHVPLARPPSTQTPAQRAAAQVPPDDPLPLVQSDIPGVHNMPSTPSQTTWSTPFAAPKGPTRTPGSDNLSPGGWSKNTDHLTPAKKAEFEGEMVKADELYAERIEEAKRNWDPATLEKRLASLKANHAAKQSGIRKKYGIKLRERKGTNVTSAERARVRVRKSVDAPPPARWTPANASSARVTTHDSGEPAAKRAKVDGAGGAVATQSEPSTRLLRASEMEGGLGQSSATAATQDPTGGAGRSSTSTASSSPSSSRARSQQRQGNANGMSLAPHQSQGSRPSQGWRASPSSRKFSKGPDPSAASRQGSGDSVQKISFGVAGMGSSQPRPMDLDAESSSDDSDSDIPA